MCSSGNLRSARFQYNNKNKNGLNLIKHKPFIKNLSFLKLIIKDVDVNSDHK